MIGDNETGFRGTNDLPYRVEAWAFLLAGGGLYNNLDYSFAAGHEDGSFVYPSTQPGGGNPAFRRQLRTLRDFLYSFDFIQMRPDHTLIKSGLPSGMLGYALARPGAAYALYLGPAVRKNNEKEPGASPGKIGEIVLKIPDGSYTAQWLDPLTGQKHREEEVQAAAGTLTLRAPAYQEDLALSLKRR